MINMQMRVQDVPHVAEFQPVLFKLVLDHGFVRLQAAHAERLHDLVRAIPGVDDDRPGAAENEKAENRHPPGAAAVAPERQKLNSSSMSP